MLIKKIYIHLYVASAVVRRESETRGDFDMALENWLFALQRGVNEIT